MCIFCDSWDGSLENLTICVECLRNKEKVKVWHRAIICKTDIFRGKEKYKEEYRKLMKKLGIDYEN